ncbi:MAG: hypothetical protein OEN23_21495, partial [Paracoccaceae bacterium]|nr:hypothetical protein [Paracoccaceae bacterium]
MGKKYDASIIEACIAFERAKKSWQTLNVDKLPAADVGFMSRLGSWCGGGGLGVGPEAHEHHPK